MQTTFHLDNNPKPNQKALEQYQTPLWAAEALCELFLSEIERRGEKAGRIAEPSCGVGHFLESLPPEIPAYGIELDPPLAETARKNSGREVFCEDFLLSETPSLPGYEPDHFLGNPPFKIETVRGFLQKAHGLLPDGGCCGFILPTHSFQHTHTLLDWNKNWRIQPWLLPRDIFQGLSVPILFALFQKEQGTELEGFALYRATHRIKAMPALLKQTLCHGNPEKPGAKSTWTDVVTHALQHLGGRASLPELYKTVEPLRPTDNPHWKEKIRQILQLGPFQKTEDAWSLA